ncbi:MAG: DUF2520 domain-containing protein [Firmicutes bacterium]|nr:DUF2520 domain-containing protein [Bacillota bacterium]
MRKIAIIGPGRVGTALAVHLARRGYPVAAVAGRSRASLDRFLAKLTVEGMEPEIASAAEAARRAEIVFITTPDKVIGDIAALLAEAAAVHEGQVVVQTSGALSSAVLLPAAKCGASVLSFHPLQSFATVERGIELLPGCSVVLDGDPAGIEVGGELARVLGLHTMTIPTEVKPLYHAAACTASNYLVTLVGLSLDLLEECGLDRGEALRALLPLIRGTVENVAALGVPEALTGPIERGDTDILRGHLEAMGRRLPRLDEVYRVLGAETVRLAARKGRLSEEDIVNMLAVFEPAEGGAGGTCR